MKHRRCGLYILIKSTSDKVNVEIAKKLKPQSVFLPLGYVGDPASFELVKGGEILSADAEYGALLIEAFLKQNKKQDISENHDF